MNYYCYSLLNLNNKVNFIIFNCDITISLAFLLLDMVLDKVESIKSVVVAQGSHWLF